MPEKYSIIGTGRTAFTDKKYQEEILSSVNQFSRNGKVKKEQWAEFEPNVHYCSVDISEEKTFENLKKEIEKQKKKNNFVYRNRLRPLQSAHGDS